MRYEFGGLIFGGAYTWRGLFSEFYGISSKYKCAKSFVPPSVSANIAVSELSVKRKEKKKENNCIELSLFSLLTMKNQYNSG